MPRFPVARFHVQSGPPELFERVRFKMRVPRTLKTHSAHVQSRSEERSAPLELLKRFDPSEWRLMTADVRTDKGKFVSTAWMVEAGGSHWWVAIGLEETITTVIRIDRGKTAFGPDIVRSGPVYDFVAEVNRQLMKERGGTS